MGIYRSKAQINKQFLRYSLDNTLRLFILFTARIRHNILFPKFTIYLQPRSSFYTLESSKCLIYKSPALPIGKSKFSKFRIVDFSGI